MTAPALAPVSAVSSVSMPVPTHAHRPPRHSVVCRSVYPDDPAQTVTPLPRSAGLAASYAMTLEMLAPPASAQLSHLTRYTATLYDASGEIVYRTTPAVSLTTAVRLAEAHVAALVDGLLHRV